MACDVLVKEYFQVKTKSIYKFASSNMENHKYLWKGVLLLVEKSISMCCKYLLVSSNVEDH